MQEFFQILTNFGFPVALSCYLLLRFEKILADLSKIIADLVTKNTALETKNADILMELKSVKENVVSLKALLARKRK